MLIKRQDFTGQEEAEVDARRTCGFLVYRTPRTWWPPESWSLALEHLPADVVGFFPDRAKAERAAKILSRMRSVNWPKLKLRQPGRDGSPVALPLKTKARIKAVLNRCGRLP